MEDYSLDLASEQIHNSKTKTYFREVLESYHIGNYRATVVMLYSVVICDLLYKLQELKEIYNDNKAKEILDDIEILQKEKPKSPDWENSLLEFVNNRTKLLEISTYENIQILQKHRHLCAHPVMDKNYELYRPNKETTRAHLRNMLESIFTKSLFHSKEVFTELIKDIADKRSYFPPRYDNNDFERYLNSVYFKFSPPSTIEYIFRNLWKFTFRLKDKECADNRDINYNTLFIMYKNYRNELLDSIKSNKSHYSKIEKGNPCQFIISFVSIYSEIYNQLEEQAKIIIQKEAQTKSQFKIKAWYLSENLSSHVEMIRDIYNNDREDNFYEEINLSALSALIRNVCNHNECENVFNLAIEIYTNAGSFSYANTTFRILIAPNIRFLNLINVKKMLEGIEKNDQTYLRNYAFSEHNKIANYINEKYQNDIDVSIYPNFCKSITKTIEKDEDLPF